MRSVLFGVRSAVWTSLLLVWTVFASERPNILLILSDDMGYSDIGCYGGDAETPTLDALAKNGIRFTQFYNTARCMPTRASLLTGLHPHQAGIGHMGGNWDPPAYSGHLLKTCVTIGEVLQQAGYHTSHLGKWHVGNRRNEVMPDLRGFDRNWTRQGKVDYFLHDIYELDGEKWTCPEPQGFYSTDWMDRMAVNFIDDARSQDKPFFMYAAYDAAHWPLHAKPEEIKKYRGRFVDKGWDRMREERYRRQIKLGVISEDWPLPPRDPAIPAWDEVDDKEDWDLRMAVYCAQIDAMDRSIGRIINHLKSIDELNNTLILFMQDNGACAEGIGRKKKNEVPGTPESHQAYFMPWAHVSNTPFRMYKHFTGEGGISTPLIACWPAGIEKPGRIYDGMGHLVDIMATCVEVAEAEYPTSYKGNAITPLEGRSLVPVFRNGMRAGHDVFCWEHEGNRAVRRGKWKLVSRYHDDVRYFKQWGYPKAPRRQEWELYDLEADRTEQHELSARYPEIAAELKKEYEAWAGRVGARPFDEVKGKGK